MMDNQKPNLLGSHSMKVFDGEYLETAGKWMLLLMLVRHRLFVGRIYVKTE